MAPWQMTGFVREKVERARRLLAEPGEQQGSADLQARAKAMGIGAEGGRPGDTSAWNSELCCSALSRPAFQKWHTSQMLLQRYVRNMDWLEALHRTFLDESGEERQGLRKRERLQVGRRWLRRSSLVQRS